MKKFLVYFNHIAGESKSRSNALKEDSLESAKLLIGKMDRESRLFIYSNKLKIRSVIWGADTVNKFTFEISVGDGGVFRVVSSDEACELLNNYPDVLTSSYEFGFSEGEE